MQWIVILDTDAGEQVVNVSARNRQDAEHRAAYKAEASGCHVYGTKRAMRRA